MALKERIEILFLFEALCTQVLFLSFCYEGKEWTSIGGS